MSKLVDIKYEAILHETNGAYLFMIGDKEVWLPREAVEVHEDERVVVVPENLVIKKEIEDYAL